MKRTRYIVVALLAGVILVITGSAANAATTTAACSKKQVMITTDASFLQATANGELTNSTDLCPAVELVAKIIKAINPQEIQNAIANVPDYRIVTVHGISLTAGQWRDVLLVIDNTKLLIARLEAIFCQPIIIDPTLDS